MSLLQGVGAAGREAVGDATLDTPGPQCSLRGAAGCTETHGA